MSDRSSKLAEKVRAARDAGQALHIRGNGSKHWLETPDQASTLSLAGHQGIVSYDPTELVVTVRAGTPITELEQALAEQGQMLACEPVNVAGRSTIGGALALGWSGPRSAWAGTLRDFVLGMKVLTAEGDILSFGGQVMKNVAGYDVSRLLVGSRGGLAAVLEVSLKVLPLPEQELVLSFTNDDPLAAMRRVREWEGQSLPLSGALWQAGALMVRFSGRTTALSHLLSRLGGEARDAVVFQRHRELSAGLLAGTPPLRLYRQRPLSAIALDQDFILDHGGRLLWARAGGDLATLMAAANAHAVESPVAGVQSGNAVTQHWHTALAKAFDPQGLWAPAGEAA